MGLDRVLNLTRRSLSWPNDASSAPPVLDTTRRYSALSARRIAGAFLRWFVLGMALGVVTCVVDVFPHTRPLAFSGRLR